MQQIYLIIGSVSGAVITFLMHKHGFGVVAASCIVGLLGCLIENLVQIPHLALVVFAGSFVGMTSTSVADVSIIILAGLITGLVYIFSLNVFDGFGGRLGTIAFISTVIAFYILFWVKQQT